MPGPEDQPASEIGADDPRKVEKLSKLGHKEEAKSEGDEAAEGEE